MVTVDAPATAEHLVDALLSAGAITSPRVEAAFRAVPRHLFVPHVPVEAAYRNEAVPTKLLDGRAVSSASQPSIVAVMLEQLDVAPGHRGWCARSPGRCGHRRRRGRLRRRWRRSPSRRPVRPHRFDRRRLGRDARLVGPTRRWRAPPPTPVTARRPTLRRAREP